VFGALEFLSTLLVKGGSSEPDPNRVLSRLDATRRFEIELTFELGTDERRDFIDLVRLGGPDSGARDRLLASQFLRRVSYRFQAPPTAPNLPHLRETKLIAENGVWAPVQRMTGHETTANPVNSFLAFRSVGETFAYHSLQASTLDIDRVTATQGSRMVPEHNVQSVPLESQVPQDDGSTWLRERLKEYLSRAFFFSPFRVSERVQTVAETYELAQNGSNLALVLNTLKTNDEDVYQQIEAFVYGALPDIGRLRSPLRGTQTQVDFQSPLGDYDTRLCEMGGGVEQLLMAAVVLLTTGDQNPILLEEPESHLHAGAQRYLIERLYEGDRQVFVTTHSPTFINQSRPKSLYQVTLSQGSTSISKVEGQGELGTVLEDIGARNSDVLLSDAVLFVEGDSDRDTLVTWADTLDLGLAKRNIQVLPMEGGEHVARGARPRADVLEGISHAAPVPHMFVVDRDERPERDVEKLQNSLGDSLHVLQRRELENYLLIPRAIRDAIAFKHHVGNPEITRAVEETSEEEIGTLIEEAVEGLHGRVLLNRVRAEIPGLQEGFMPRKIVAALASDADSTDLHDKLRHALKARVDTHLSRVDLEALVCEQRDLLQKEWSEPEKRKELAPGADVLEMVFGRFGSKFRKSKDAPRVAERMTLEEIPDEITNLLRKVAELTDTA
jgi:hypothetical protein